MSLRAWLEYGRQTGRGERKVSARQVDTVLTVVVIGIIIILGTLIYSEVQTSVFPNVGTDVANNTELENASSTTTEEFGSAMELAPVILIVLLAGVILGVVQRFQ